MKDILLEVISLTKRYPASGGGFRAQTVKAVESVNFQLQRGETLGLIGESGCGKSTLGRVLGQLAPATSGQIRFDGRDISKSSRRELRELRQQIQIIFQDPYGSLNPRMTIRDIVVEPLRNFGIARGVEAENIAVRMLNLCGLGRSVLDRYPREFSGGQRQRIGIARALVLKPKFVVADEPVSALDVSIQAQVINLLKDLQRELGMTYLFIGHDMAVVKHVSDRVAVMYLGRVVEIGTMQQVYGNPRHPYTKVLLSSVPIPDPEQERQRTSITLKGALPSPLSPPSGCPFHTRCPWAQLPLCSTVEPASIDVGEGHLSSCHFAVEGVTTTQHKPPFPVTK
ncbi:oligopeptide/dipeptide ABC transporter ATP-binding protein [Caballeronia udeis]|uniref:Oligopeptide/dipeptide ABC transporter ATP-binding protein n=1 Tax=Caballeronia udeis TaxID=1232866 RepID=A0ABW8MQQ1_9BURK